MIQGSGFLHVIFLLCFFETGSHCVAQTSLKLEDLVSASQMLGLQFGARTLGFLLALFSLFLWHHHFSCVLRVFMDGLGRACRDHSTCGSHFLPRNPGDGVIRLGCRSPYPLSPLQTLLLLLLFIVCLHVYVCDVHVCIYVSTCMCVGMHMCMCEHV